MSARRVAMFCLLAGTIPVAMAAHSGGDPLSVSLRLRTGELPRATFDAAKGELAALLDRAGVRAEWENPGENRDVPGLSVVIDLEGDCRVNPHENAPSVAEGTPIGSTATIDHRLLPFISLNCTTLRALLASSLAVKPSAAREFVFGRALGRVLAHEVYHVLTQSENHAESGIAKPNFSAADLVKTRFEFDGVSVNRMRASLAEEPVETSVDTPAFAASDDISAGK